MFVMLSFLEFLNVFRKWYDAGTTGQEGGGASMPEGMFERVELLRVLRVGQCQVD